ERRERRQDQWRRYAAKQGTQQSVDTRQPECEQPFDAEEIANLDAARHPGQNELLTVALDRRGGRVAKNESRQGADDRLQHASAERALELELLQVARRNGH